jgi:hypothetical protein
MKYEPRECPICLGENKDVFVVPECNHALCLECSHHVKQECYTCKKKFVPIMQESVLPNITVNTTKYSSDIPELYSWCKCTSHVTVKGINQRRFQGFHPGKSTVKTVEGYSMTWAQHFILTNKEPISLQHTLDSYENYLIHYYSVILALERDEKNWIPCIDLARITFAKQIKQELQEYSKKRQVYLVNSDWDNHFQHAIIKAVSYKNIHEYSKILEFAHDYFGRECITLKTAKEYCKMREQVLFQDLISKGYIVKGKDNMYYYQQ